MWGDDWDNPAPQVLCSGCAISCGICATYAPCSDCGVCEECACKPADDGAECAWGVCEDATCKPPPCSGCGEMVTIPAGEFWFGCKDTGPGTCQSSPGYLLLDLPAYEIDRFEVTSADFTAFVDGAANNCGGQPRFVEVCFGPPAGSSGQIAVQNATWAGANAFCLAQGKRLCSDTEWEKGGRGADGRLYAWGDEAPTCELTVMMGNGGVGCGALTPWPVGSKPAGKGPHGLYDMTGCRDLN